MAAVVGRVAGKPAGDVGTSVARFARRHGKRYIDLDRVTDERVVMLGAKKEQLETGSGAHKIERTRLATGVADPRLQKRDLKRRRRRAQRLDHLRQAVPGLFNKNGRAHVSTPYANVHLVGRVLLDIKKRRRT